MWVSTVFISVVQLVAFVNYELITWLQNWLLCWVRFQQIQEQKIILSAIYLPLWASLLSESLGKEKQWVARLSKTTQRLRKAPDGFMTMIACHYPVWTLFEAEIVLIDFNGSLGFKASTILRGSWIDAQYKESKHVFVPFFIYFEMFLKLYLTLDEFTF